LEYRFADVVTLSPVWLGDILDELARLERAAFGGTVYGRRRAERMAVMPLGQRPLRSSLTIHVTSEPEISPKTRRANVNHFLTTADCWKSK